MQTVGEPVKVDEAGRYPDHLAPPRGDCFDLGDGAVHDVGERQKVLGGAQAGDVEDLGLGPVDDHVHVALTGIRPLGDSSPGIDETAPHGGVAHDLGVVAGVRGSRHRGDERVEVGGAADPVQIAGLGEPVRHGDRISGFAAREQVGDGREDDLVRRAVEVRLADYLDDIRDGILAQQHATQDGLFGGDVLRRGAVRGRLGDDWHVGRWGRVLRNGHRRHLPVVARRPTSSHVVVPDEPLRRR